MFDNDAHHVIGGKLGQQGDGGADGKRNQAEGAVAGGKGDGSRTAQYFAGFELPDILIDDMGFDNDFFDKVDAAFGLAGGAGGVEDDADVIGTSFTFSKVSAALAISSAKSAWPLALTSSALPPTMNKLGWEPWKSGYRLPPPPRGGH